MLDYCPICKAPKDSEKTVCDACATELDRECFDSFMSRCPVCKFPKSHGPYKCLECSKGYQIYPVARFDGNLSYSVLYGFKFLAHKEMASVVACWLQKGIDALDPDERAIVVPVPCSGSRLKTNGWDHMVEVAKHLGRPYLELVSNNSETVQQKKLGKEDRASLSKGKYSISTHFSDHVEALKKLKVIVIDDVYTTGNTIRSVIELLKSAGFEDVSGAVWLCDYLPIGGNDGLQRL